MAGMAVVLRGCLPHRGKAQMACYHRWLAFWLQFEISYSWEFTQFNIEYILILLFSHASYNSVKVSRFPCQLSNLKYCSITQYGQTVALIHAKGTEYFFPFRGSVTFILHVPVGLSSTSFLIFSTQLYLCWHT